VSPDPGWIPGQLKGLVVKKTLPILGNAVMGVITDNTSDTLSLYWDAHCGSGISFVAGQSFEINRVVQGIDQPGVGGGSLIPYLNAFDSGSAEYGVATLHFCCTVQGLNVGDSIYPFVYGHDEWDYVSQITAVDPNAMTITFDCP